MTKAIYTAGASSLKCAVAALTSLTVASGAMAASPEPVYEKYETIVEPSAPVVEPPAAYDWSGFYLGAGPVYSHSRATDSTDQYDLPSASGVGLGLLGGYNMQRGSLVFGAEVAGVLTRNQEFNDCGLGGSASCEVTIDNFVSVRGRVGAAFGRTLVFGTLGYATDQWAMGVPGERTSIRYHGAVIGIGAEHAIADRTSVRADLEHYRFGSKRNAGDSRVGLSTTLVRLSVVQRF